MRKPEEIASAFHSTDSLDGVQGFFLVGIGGAGMSALARLFLRRRYAVCGTDSVESAEIQRLRSEGIESWVGHSAEKIDSTHALVVSDAIDLSTSPEVARARKIGIPIVRRSQALGWLLRAYKVIAVTGTHGKTTTTGMLGAALEAVGLDPLVVVGATVPLWGGPVREGAGPFAVVEACEAYDSFHDLEPFSVLLTNLELDHVDFHHTYERLRSSVVRFVDKIPPEGWLVYCSEDRGACEVAELSSAKALPYGASDAWQRQVANLTGADFGTLPNFPSGSTLTLPGQHNLLNAAGALTTAATVTTDLEKVERALRAFGGAERRLQVLQTEPIVVVNDYAHHPSEIAASLSALRDQFFSPIESKSRLIVVFQPHLYSRTAGHYREFAEALDAADEVFLTDIYPARESPMAGVSSAVIAEFVTKKLHYVPNRRLLPREVARLARPDDVVVGMGAGTIGEFAPRFIEEFDDLQLLRKGDRPIRVAVLFGGDSAEREVSLHSGIAAIGALKRLGYEVVPLDLTENILQGQGLEIFTGEHRPDVVFLAVHGTHAEDGSIQGFLEMLHMPYTGSKLLSSAVCMDKAATKAVLKSHDIRTPEGILLSDPSELVSLQTPLIVKPNAQGSTVGLTFVTDRADLDHAIRRALSFDSRALVEEWIIGMEISVPVLGGKALTPVEIAPTSGRYDFSSKYLPGATEEIIPARLDHELTVEVQQIAEVAHRALGCEGATRTDAIVRGREVFVLEVNTLPGLTPTSLLPNSAAHGGIDFDELCRSIVMEAIGIDASKT
jgi:UDP-N-acetylmuramate--L-alanine ligase